VSRLPPKMQGDVWRTLLRQYKKMLQIQMTVPNKGMEFAISAKGHAGAGASGQDIVCAAASIVTYVVAETVLSMWKGRKLQKKPVVRLSSGSALIHCSPLTDYREEVQAAFRFAATGYGLLSRSYADNVQFIKLDGA
jgi:uncharacterized protein YsxB (DUF464 family)